MRRFINPILLFAAHSSHADLIRQIQYLKVENEVLRSKLPRRITIEPRERERLIRYGRAAGKAVFQLVSIVTRSCFYQWLRRGQPRRPRTTHPPGRPRTPEQVEELVLRLARETGWGYTRILGELKKLSIRTVSRSTVVNILKGAGLETGPKRGQATWDEFIARHAQSLWACDFLARRVLTWRGWKDAHILVFINVKSRLAWVAMANPDQIMAVDEAFRRLETEDAEAASVVRLRFYAGLSVEQIAEVLNTSPRSVARLWQYAKAVMFRTICDGG